MQRDEVGRRSRFVEAGNFIAPVCVCDAFVRIYETNAGDVFHLLICCCCPPEAPMRR